jgi:chorismate mutase/prephenate dehydratase
MNPADMSPEHMALAALRHEIDLLDDELLALFERRLAIAARVGQAKDAPHGPHVKLRPDRETGGAGRASSPAPAPDNREAVSEPLAPDRRLGPGPSGHGCRCRSGRPSSRPAPSTAPASASACRRRHARMVRDPQAALKPGPPKGTASLSWPSTPTTPGGPGCAVNGPSLSLSSTASVGGGHPDRARRRQDRSRGLAERPPRHRRYRWATRATAVACAVRAWPLDHGWTLSLTDADLEPGEVEGCVGAVG